MFWLRILLFPLFLLNWPIEYLERKADERALRRDEREFRQAQLIDARLAFYRAVRLRGACELDDPRPAFDLDVWPVGEGDPCPQYSRPV